MYNCHPDHDTFIYDTTHLQSTFSHFYRAWNSLSSLEGEGHDYDMLFHPTQNFMSATSVYQNTITTKWILSYVYYKFWGFRGFQLFSGPLKFKSKYFKN